MNAPPPLGCHPGGADVPTVSMRQNASTGKESTAGPMGPIEKHHVVCHDCAFEEVVDDGWTADDLALEHRGATNDTHQVSAARIE
jgi:hypothetical protein